MTTKTEKPWYSIAAKADDSADIYIYEQIGADWFSEGVQAKAFVQDLAAVKAAKINLRINSPGGSVFDGQTIYNAIKRHPAQVTTYVDGVAASIASVIALAGDKVVMAKNALFMIHNPWGTAQGSADELRKYADVLDKVRETIVSVYREKTAMTDEEIVAAMDAETWMTADEAQAFGFVDEISADSAAVNIYNCAGMGFRNAPQPAVVHDQVEPSVQAEVIPPQGANKPEMEVVVMQDATTTAPQNGATTEAAAIAAMCADNNCAHLAADFISNGLSADQAGRRILELRAADRISTPSAEAKQLVLNDKEQKQYSYQNAIKAAIDIREGRAASGFEVDIHQELAKMQPVNYAAKGGIFVPLATSLTTGGSTTGAEVVRTQYGDLIDMLRAMSVTTRMGATTLTGLTGPVTFPKQTGASTLSWTGEAGAAVSESNLTLGTVTLSPKTAMAKGSVSRQLILQSTPNAEGLIRNDLAAIAALGIDKAAIHGAGASNEPDGLYHLANVNAVAMGGVPTFGKLVDMATECAKDNALLGNLGFVTTPGMAGKLRQSLVASSAGSDMIFTGTNDGGSIAGYKALASNQVLSTLGGGSEHGIVFGNWSDMIIGTWGGGIEITVDPYTLADQGLVRLILFVMADIIVRHPESFCKATGATIA